MKCRSSTCSLIGPSVLSCRNPRDGGRIGRELEGHKKCHIAVGVDPSSCLTHSTSSLTPSTVPVPIETMAEEKQPAAQEQDINPWSVEGGRDENGEVVAINYEAICRYVPAQPLGPQHPLTAVK